MRMPNLSIGKKQNVAMFYFMVKIDRNNVNTSHCRSHHVSQNRTAEFNWSRFQPLYMTLDCWYVDTSDPLHKCLVCNTPGGWPTLNCFAIAQ